MIELAKRYGNGCIIAPPSEVCFLGANGSTVPSVDTVFLPYWPKSERSLSMRGFPSRSRSSATSSANPRRPRRCSTCSARRASRSRTWTTAGRRGGLRLCKLRHSSAPADVRCALVLDFERLAPGVLGTKPTFSDRALTQCSRLS